MLSRRTSLTSAIAALGVGAAIVLATPASAASAAPAYGDRWIKTRHCQGDQKIELHSYDGVMHDAQRVVSATPRSYCLYTLKGNGRTVWTGRGGADSGWRYDGPGHHMCAYVTDLLIGLPKTVEGVCN
ncbi:hypothetical protein [Kitasatospora sp. NPDC056531]|uniref:hypothetical protein n=1 Tax=Kitasatospora sp. NPDC056531 TaxID=3345856 RepID=UPI003690C64C